MPSPPVDRSTIWPYEDGDPAELYYSRTAHPAGLEAERRLGELEGGPALLFPSGAAATPSVVPITMTPSAPSLASTPSSSIVTVLARPGPSIAQASPRTASTRCAAWPSRPGPVAPTDPVMRAIAFFVPASHVFEGMRAVILDGVSFPTRELALAFAIDVLYVVGSAWLFSWSLRQVRVRGLLSRFGE